MLNFTRLNVENGRKSERDLKYLTEKGAKVLSLKPFDMFCHTYHVETVAIIDVKEVYK